MREREGGGERERERERQRQRVGGKELQKKIPLSESLVTRVEQEIQKKNNEF